jgi:hypothetical protein
MDTAIDRLKLDLLKNETHVQVHDNVNTLFNRQTPEQIEEMDLEPLLALYRPACKNETDALDILVKSKYTPLLHEKDHERDDAYRGFVSTVKGLCHHFDAEQRDAANRVMDVIRHYGNIPARPLDDETAAINDMAREFQRADLAADIKTIRAEDWLDRLVARNTEYDSLTDDRFREGAAKTAYRMKTARRTADKYYRNIVMHLEYLITVGRETPELTNVIRELNEIVAHYKNILAQRYGKKK